jgi:hypothetical protein
MKLRELLDRIKARHHLDTDYKACKILQVSQSRVSTALKRNSTPDDDLIISAEKLLDMPPGSLLFEAHAERSKCAEAAKILHDMSVKLMSTAAAIVLAVSMTYAMPDLGAGAPALASVVQQQCILCKIQYWLICTLGLCLFTHLFRGWYKYPDKLSFLAVSQMTKKTDFDKNNKLDFVL